MARNRPTLSRHGSLTTGAPNGAIFLYQWLPHHRRSLHIIPFQQRAETTTRFIPATLHDNLFINAEYRDILDNLTSWQRRAWRDGDWDIAAGQFFTTFRRDVHVIDEFNDHRAVEWFAALDYGFAHYTVVLLGGYDGDGNFFVVDEHAARNWMADSMR